MATSPLVWPKERCREEALKYSTLKEFEIGCRGAYRSARDRGWLDEICPHIKRRINPANHWTKERCGAEATKFQTRNEFRTTAEAAYSAAKKRGWLDEICTHMACGKSSLWTFKACEQEALKYETRTAFRAKSPTAYEIAREKDWLNDICWFMGGSVRDGLYIIREELPEGDRFLVKIGHTTFDRGDYRVRQGFRHFEKPILVLYERNKSATRIERSLLRRFKLKPDIPVYRQFDGHTELRMMTAEEIGVAIAVSREGRMK